jgi:hypothetical protein
MLEKAVSERSYVESHGKPVPGFSFMSGSEAAAKVADRRKQVHSRWLKLWAKRILATPEQALVPLKERDALLASRHEVRGWQLAVKPGSGSKLCVDDTASCVDVSGVNSGDVLATEMCLPSCVWKLPA